MTRAIAQKFFTAKSVTALISLIFTLTSLAVLACVIFLLVSLDRHVAWDRAQWVDVLLNNEEQYLQAVLEEYSYWDEAYEKIIVHPDEEWIEDNSGRYLVDRHQFDFSLAIGPDMEPGYLVTSTKTEGLEFGEIASDGLKALIDEATQIDTETGKTVGTAGGFMRIGSDLFLVVLHSFKDETTDEYRSGVFLAVGRRLDKEYMTKLQATYKIANLRLARDYEKLKDFKALDDVTGKEVGRLTWTLQRPSLLLGPKIAGVVGLFFGLAILLVYFLMKREHADRAEYENRLYKEATQDPLTSLSNRRYFMALGQQEIALHRREEQKLTVIFLDIDHFKAINDTHGHSVGDEALIHFSEVCAHELRESDIFGRIGGEEFAAILPQTPLDSALEVANRICNKVQESPLVVDGVTIKMTVSIGVSTMNGHPVFDKILEQADEALFMAKEGGRNRVYAYSQMEDPVKGQNVQQFAQDTPQ